jgi:hypothetical protein
MNGKPFRAYAMTYMACFFLALVFTLGDALSKSDVTTEQHLGHLVGACIAAFIMGALSIPIRILLSLFPERSPSSLVRLLRRMLLGVLVGPTPPLILAGFVTLFSGTSPEVLQAALALGVGFGLITGLIDSLDHDAKLPRDHDQGALAEPPPRVEP